MNYNMDQKEIEKFDKISSVWWDLSGKMGALQRINPLRTEFVLGNLRSTARLEQTNILDLGCGGGILSESLAKSGAKVTGVDLSQAALEVARKHAAEQQLSIEYLCSGIEDVAEKKHEYFDAITCMEMLEHVPDPREIVRSCARAVKPGGHVFISTIDRSLKSFIFAKIGGEYILRLLEIGTHSWTKFIRPAELKLWCKDAGLEFKMVSSLSYNPFLKRFKILPNREDVFYMMHFIKK